MKRKDEHEKLYKLMCKIYAKDQVGQRTDEIDVREVVGVEFQHLIYKPTYRETFLHPMLRKASWIGCFVTIYQQLTGVNAIIFYSTVIFEQISEQDQQPQFPYPN